MSNENNAGVDLAQLDKLELRAKEEKGEGYKLMAVKHDVILALIDLARRASATPSSKDAGGEPMYQISIDCTNVLWKDVDKEDYDEHPSDWKREKRIVYAAPAHAAAAPSDLTTVPCPSCDGKSACDDCTGQGRIIVSAKDMAELSAGAAAKTEQVDEDECAAPITNGACSECGWGPCSRAAGAGSEQPLPPLPRNYGRFNVNGPDEHRIRGWTSEQMQEYGRACYALARAPLHEQDDDARDAAWASVDDRLPPAENEDTGREVMVSNSMFIVGDAIDGGHGIGLGDYSPDAGWRCYGGDFDFMHITKVTAYMPTPRPGAIAAAMSASRPDDKGEKNHG